MTNAKKRFDKLRKGQMKSQRKLTKARAERIWIEENPHIHILNYSYYKFKRWVKREE